jgi:hypothetical protein
MAVMNKLIDMNADHLEAFKRKLFEQHQKSDNVYTAHIPPDYLNICVAYITHSIHREGTKFANRCHEYNIEEQVIEGLLQAVEQVQQEQASD